MKPILDEKIDLDSFKSCQVKPSWTILDQMCLNLLTTMAFYVKAKHCELEYR